MEIIIHCSDSSYGTAVLIDKWHRIGGFTEIGYHAVILNGRTHSRKYITYWDGKIETGRREGKIGAHTKGHNKAWGVCLVGKSGDFTDRQIDTLVDYLKRLSTIAAEKDEVLTIKQHSDYDNKKDFCAGLNMDDVLERLS